MSVTITSFQTGPCRSYLLVSGAEGVLVDPHISLVDSYRQAVKKAGLTVRAIVDTHTHADHISSAALCAKAFGAPVVMSAAAISQQDIRKVQGGDSVEFGDTKIEILDAPGHTDDSIALRCEGNLFTGDVLLIGSVGRCDFQNGSPESMFESLAKLKLLPGETIIHPAHDYQGHTESTLAAELENNSFLQESSQEAFVATARRTVIPKPANMDPIIEINRAGSAGEIQLLSPQEAQAKLTQAPNDWTLLDVRTPEEYRSVHIEPSQNVPLDTVGLRAKELAAKPGHLILSCQSGARAKKAAEALAVAGAPNLYLLDGAITAWQKADLPVKRTGPAFTLIRQVHTIAGSMILIGAILALAVHPLWVILCLFVGLGLFIAGTTGQCMMAILLLKLPWNKIEATPGPSTGGGCSMSGGGCSMPQSKKS